MPPTNVSVPELLTVEEFALRFRVGRSTVFFWIANKKMLQGIHYFKVGKTIRIPWSVELLTSLSTDPVEVEAPHAIRTGKKRNSINFDF